MKSHKIKTMKKTVYPIMLPTDKSCLGFRNGFPIYRENEPFTTYGNAEPQHLYFVVSDEHIKEGDWFIADGYYEPFKCRGYDGDMILSTSQKTGGKHATPKGHKIIATTDISMFKSFYTKEELGGHTPINYGIPQISELFIKHYVDKQGKVECVEIEYGLDKGEVSILNIKEDE